MKPTQQELRIQQNRTARNWRPIGSERMDRGYKIRKVTDTGQPKKDWKRVDVIEWEAVNGPVPEGMVLVVAQKGLLRAAENLVLAPADRHQVGRPHLCSPLGTERLRDGVIQRKVAATGNRRTDWKRVDEILWESAYGPIPHGKVLTVKDTTQPRTLDNLELLTKEEHMRRVSVNNLPPEVAELFQLKAKINRRVKGMERKAESERSETT